MAADKVGAVTLVAVRITAGRVVPFKVGVVRLVVVTVTEGRVEGVKLPE